jgi:hypothetical protein
MAPALAAGSPDAPELLAKLVVVMPPRPVTNKDEGDQPLVGEWLRAKLAAPQNGRLSLDNALMTTQCSGSQCPHSA